MEGINAWWEGVADERFWLGVTSRDGEGEVLSAPCDAGRRTSPSTLPLITHVKDGDVVFHFDEAQPGIVGWSIARGPARKERLAWPELAQDPDLEGPALRLLPRWVTVLESTTSLHAAVPLDQIARVQWDMFPALRALEDAVGVPLHYPFAMGSPSHTHLLAGHVFKLPGLFVGWFPALARVAELMRWSATAHVDAIHRSGTRAAAVAASPDARIVPATAYAPEAAAADPGAWSAPRS